MNYDQQKRILDLICATILLFAFSPILLLTAVAIVIDSPGPVFADIPDRAGKGGKLFKLYKFRSMIPNAQHLLMNDPKYKHLYEEYKKNNYKLKYDPRITRIGSFIRKYSIDEFPQLINVLRGEMSMVGPRAYHAFELKEQAERLPSTVGDIKKVQGVLPGITGLWQVSGRSTIDFEKRIRLDASYAEKRSIFYDIYLLLKTPWAIISAKGAY